MINRIHKGCCLAILLTFLLGTAQAQHIVLNWAKLIGASDNDFGLGISTDKWGNVYTSGIYNGTVDFDPGAGTSALTAMANGDVFLAKYDAAGNFKWVKGFGNNNEDKGFDVKADDWGNVYITGQFALTVNLNPGGSNGTLVGTNGFNDIFVAKYDSSGALSWARRIGGPEDDIAYGIDVDAKGSVYLTGEFSGTVDFDPGTGTANLVSNGGSDIFMCKLDSTGKYVWAKGIGGTNYDYGYGISVDASGYVYNTGIFSGAADFNPGAGSNILTPAGGYDIYISKYDSMGNYVWANRFGGSGDDRGMDIALSDSGNIYVTGHYSGSVDFDPGSGNTFLSPIGGTDIFAAKYKSDGTLIWAKGLGGSAYDYGNSIAVDPRGNAFLIGYFESASVDLDPGAGNAVFNNKGDNDFFVVKLNNDGNYAWGFTMGGLGFDIGYDIAVDRSGGVYTTGYTRETVDFDPGAGTTNLTSAGGYDCFIQKLICVDTSSKTVSVELCEDSYTYNGETYTVSGDYTQKFVNNSGCDSTLFLRLDLKGKLEKPVINVTGFVLGTVLTYAKYQWFKNGVLIPGATQSTYTVKENADYTVVVFNAKGCTDTSAIYKVTNTAIGDPGRLGDGISVYPNPTLDQVHIVSPVPVQLSLSSMDGRLIKQVAQAQEISLQDLATGMYLLRITDAEGNLLKVEKLVKGKF